MKPLLSCLLVFATVFSLTACTGGADTSSSASNSSLSSGQQAGSEPAPSAENGADANLTAPGELPIVKDPITLTAMIKQSPDIIDFATNAYTLWMEEQTNIKLEFEQIPENALKEKLSIVLAGGDLPDILLGCDLTTQQDMQYGMKEQMIIPLNDLIDRYGVETKKVFEKYPIMEQLAKNMDGQIYALPTWSALEHSQVAQRLWINTEWINRLGLKMPANTDEFYEVLKAFKEKDPNGNGQADEIPLMGSPQLWNGLPDGFIIEAFTYYDGKDGKHLVVGADNQLEYIGVKPEYREALRYLRKLYAEGLIYEASYTQTSDQAKQVAESPEAELVGGLSSGQLHLTFTVGEERYRHFDTLAPLKGPDGAQYSYYNMYGNVRLGAFAISSKCKNPEAAFRWADYCYTTDASIRLRQGVKGEDWRDAQAGEVGFYGEPAEIARLKPWLQEAQNSNWSNTGLWCEPAEMRLNTAVDPNLDVYSADGLQLFWETKSKKYWDYVPDSSILVPPLRYTTEELDQIAVIESELTKAFSQNKLRFINGELDVDRDWDQYVADLERIGLSTWLQISQTAFDRFLANK